MKSKGFVLLEVILAVAMFAMGVIALGACISNGLNAEILCTEDNRARLALMNRMAEIEAGAVRVENSKSEILGGVFKGMTLKQWRKPWKRTDENKQVIDGIDEVFLEVSWLSNGAPQSKQVSFYEMQKQ